MGMGKQKPNPTKDKPLEGKWTIDLNTVPLVFSLVF